MTRPDPAHALRSHLDLAPAQAMGVETGVAVECDGYVRESVSYRGREGDRIPAFLFRPAPDRPPGGAVVAFHQHAGAFHLGKSEVAGLAGEPLQAFGPALARRGITVLAPDALTFEDRREHTSGIDPDDGDWLQHYNALAYRLVAGDTLMRKGLDDAQRALTMLLAEGDAPPGRTGVLGHSLGGLVALYLAAVDKRCRFAVVSGALCSFGAQMEAGTGINIFEVVPGLAELLDKADLVRAIAPRPLLAVSATLDPYAADADRVLAEAGHGESLRVEGPHALDQERFDAIVNWVAARAAD
jgi:dienelactone hydrolase